MINGAFVPSSCNVLFCFDIFSDIVILLFFAGNEQAELMRQSGICSSMNDNTVIDRTAKNDIK